MDGVNMIKKGRVYFDEVEQQILFDEMVSKTSLNISYFNDGIFGASSYLANLFGVEKEDTFNELLHCIKLIKELRIINKKI